MADAATLCLGCFHAAHPDRDCTRTFDGGPGRGASCLCEANIAGSQRDEDLAVLRRNLPKWEWARLSRLTAPLPSSEGRKAEQAVVEAARETAAHLESLLLHTVNERGEMTLYAADLNSLWARTRQLRASLDRSPITPRPPLKHGEAQQVTR